MTGRYRRSVLNIQEIQQSVIDNHPLTEIVDITPKIEDLKLTDDDYSYPRFDLEENLKTKEYYTNLENQNEFFIYSSDFSDRTRCTASVDSWCDDEFERECTKKVKEMLESLNEIMYENKPISDLNSEIQDECQLWIEKFPHFRISGKQILQAEDDSIQFHASSSVSSDHSELTFDPYFSFQVKGTQLPILPSEKHTNTLKRNDFTNSENFNNNEDANIPTFVEEIIAQHGEYEEFLVCHKTDTPDRESSDMHKTISYGLNINDIREKVLDKIMEKLWPEIDSLLQIIKEEENKVKEPQKKRLPSLSPIVSSQLKKSIWDSEKMENPLHGILTVSSKVLQKRDHRFGVELGVVTRPGSSLVSPNKVTSFSSLIPSIQEVPLAENSVYHSNVNFPSVPNSRTSSALQQLRKFSFKDSEWPKVFQEETENLPSVVQTPTIHVHRQISEPFDERNDTQFPTTHFSLPPIINNNNNMFLQKQIVQSPLVLQSMIKTPPEKILKRQSSRNEKNDSRPSTCKSNKSTKEKKIRNKGNNGNKQTCNPFDIPILGGLSERLLSPYPSKGSESHLPSLEPNLSTDQLVTLFPVVKSVELQRQEDNKRGINRNQSAKKYNNLNRMKR